MPQAALLAHDLVRTLGTRRVLDGFSLTAAPGHRIGLIGENGAGKSTLLRLLAGEDTPDAGTVVRPADLGFLPQEMPFDAASTISDVLDHALREARDELSGLDAITAALAGTPQDSPGYAALLVEYGVRLDRAQESGVWDADRRAAIVLAGLGLGSIPYDRTLGSLSGGQRSRLALAALLTRRPAALLLDEPTNHLDDGAAAFLEEQLRGLPGTVLLASHDRAFLDAVCTDLIDLDPSAEGPTRYGGNYTAYQGLKRAQRERWQQRFAQEEEELAELRRAAATTAQRVAPGRTRSDSEKMGYGHTTGRVQNQIARRVRSAARRLDDLERNHVSRPPEPLRFHATSLAAASDDGILVSLRDIQVPDRLSVDRLDVLSADRLLVTGPNGAGKSTLLRVLAGRLDAGGEVEQRRAPSAPSPYRLTHSVCSTRTPWSRGSGRCRSASVAGSPWRCCWRTRPISCCSTSPPTTSRLCSATNCRKPLAPVLVLWWSPATTGGCAPAGRAVSSGSVRGEANENE